MTLIPETEPQPLPATTSFVEQYDRSAIIGLMQQQMISEEEAGFRYEALRGRMRVQEFVQTEDGYLTTVEYLTPIFITEAEYQAMRESGGIRLNEIDYVYSDTPEEDKPFLSEMGPNGMIYCSEPFSFYQVEKLGNEYFFIYEIGGLSSCVSISAGPFRLMLEPDTWVEVGPSYSEEFPEGGTTLWDFVENHLADRALNATLEYLEKTDSFRIYNDLR